MNNKKSGRITGILFIIGTACGVASLSFLNVLKEENFLYSINENPHKLIIGAMLVILMAISCAGIAYSIYPVLSKYKKGLAIGSVGFRTAESVFSIFASLTILTLIPLAKDYAALNSESVLAAGNTILYMHDINGSLLGITFATGALLYNIGFYQTKLLPRWISVWGIAATLIHIIASVLAFYGVEGFSPLGLVLNMPIALQEMVMAVYLIIFGFRHVNKLKIA